MAMRVTTSMAMNTYRYNLQASMVKTNDSRNKVLTQRNFNSYSEDPVGATLAFKLRRSYYSNSSQIANYHQQFIGKDGNLSVCIFFL